MENIMSNDLKFYINGEWVDSESNELIDVINPANEEVIGQVTAGTKKDINAAVNAASEAFISFSKSTNVENKDKNPVKFINTFVFQFLNPKGVIASVIVVSTYLDPGENFVNFTTQIIILALIVSVTSITLWTFMGKFIRKFATNQKYINYFNYVMSLLLLISIITFYL